MQYETHLEQTAPGFPACAALLVTVCGCGKRAASLVPLDSESVASLEAMYGKSIRELGEEWDFSMEDLLEERIGLGRWSLDRKIEAGGKDFWQSLLVDQFDQKDMLTGFWFGRYCDSAEEAAEVAEVLYRAAVEEYGEPNGKNISGLLLNRENAFDEIREYGGSWNIMWPVGKL